MVGAVLLYTASHISQLLHEFEPDAPPQVVPLTIIFFLTYFLLASQVRVRAYASVIVRTMKITRLLQCDQPYIDERSMYNAC